MARRPSKMARGTFRDGERNFSPRDCPVGELFVIFERVHRPVCRRSARVHTERQRDRETERQTRQTRHRDRDKRRPK
eukprot:1797361-Rhodomonas_salina.1